MKKTTSIHIKGINFIIEEDAYETLKNYMSRLEQKLSNTKGKEEIIEDIELRIAELFSGEMIGTKAVIEQKDVDKTIAILGEPEQYIDEDNTEEFESKNSHSSYESQENRGNYKQGEKKLYRDMERASVAGVCSGLSAYFNIDLIIVRIIFVLLIFGGGFGFPLYIILWIVLPTANSHIDRLRMRGRPITVDSVREEVEMAASRLTKSSKNFEHQMRNDTVFTKGVNSLGRLISKIAGFFLLLFGLLFSIAFVFIFILKKGAIPVTDENGMMTPYEFGNLVFEPNQLNMIWWLGGIMLLIFIMYIVASAMRFILGIRYPWFKYLTRFTIVAMIITVICGFYVGTTFAREFSYHSEIKTKIASTANPFEITYTSLHQATNESKNIRSRHNSELTIRKGFVFHEGYRIRLRESSDSLFHIYHIRSANGITNDKSLSRAKHIRFKGELKNDTLALSNFYSYPTKDKIRAQRIRVMIEIPKGKTIVYRGEEYDTDDYYREIWIPSMNWDNPEWDY